MSDELAFFTSEQIMEELMSRKTFMGILIRADRDITSDEIEPESFQMGCRNMSPEQSISLMESIIIDMKKDMDAGNGPVFLEDEDEGLQPE